MPSVPPVDELEILDPKVDPEGKPRAVVLPDGPGVRVEVPPTVIVHNYYYTGERDFRGPLLRGGPTVLVLNHPRTGAQTYVPVQMLPGSPRVFYDKSSVAYDFGRKRVLVHFPLVGPPTVRYCDSRGSAGDAADDAAHGVSGWMTRTGIPHVVHHVTRGTGDAIHASADRIHDAGNLVAAPVTRLWQASPLSTALTSSPADRALRLREAADLANPAAPADFLGETIPAQP